MSKITITKGKLLKGDLIQIEYLKTDSSESKPAECSEKHTEPPHNDLKKAFKSLAIHSALLCEFIPVASIADIKKPDQELTKNFNVTGFTIVGEDEVEGVILSARKTLKSGKTMGFNSAKIMFNDESETAYEFVEDLEQSIGLCKDELRNFLDGKHGDDVQGKLDLPE